MTMERLIGRPLLLEKGRSTAPSIWSALADRHWSMISHPLRGLGRSSALTFFFYSVFISVNSPSHSFHFTHQHLIFSHFSTLFLSLVEYQCLQIVIPTSNKPCGTTRDCEGRTTPWRSKPGGDPMANPAPSVGLSWPRCRSRPAIRRLLCQYCNTTKNCALKFLHLSLFNLITY